METKTCTGSPSAVAPLSAHARQQLTATQWARGIGRIVLESVCGMRPVSRYDRWMTREVSDCLLGYQKAWRQIYGTKRRLIKLGRPHLQCPREGTAECSLTFTVNGTTRVVAMRLDMERRQWILSALELRL